MGISVKWLSLNGVRTKQRSATTYLTGFWQFSAKLYVCDEPYPENRPDRDVSRSGHPYRKTYKELEFSFSTYPGQVNLTILTNATFLPVFGLSNF